MAENEAYFRIPDTELSVNVIEESDDGSTVFVGNIPYKVTWSQLKKHFGQFGEVLYAKILTDYVTRKPKGYGFVEFSSAAEAERAVNASNEQLECCGRLLRVSHTDHSHPQRKSAHNKQKNFSQDKKMDWQNKENMIDHSEVSTSDDTCTFSLLNDDVLILILGCLGTIDLVRVERVCKRWHRCSLSAAKQQKHLVLQKKQTSFGFSVFTEPIFHQILKRCSQNLQTLDLSYVTSQLRNKALEIIGLCCQNLEVLDMSGMDCTSVGMKGFTERCTKLKSITAKGCIQLNEKGFWYLFHNCKHLENLNCAGNKGITGKCLRHAEASLKHLRLKGCSNVVDEGFLQLPTRCPNLETLDLDFCLNVTTGTISTVLKGLPWLTEFNTGQKPDTANLPHHMTQDILSPALLVSLSVFNTSLQDPGLQHICQSCVNLRELDISCNRLTNISVTQLISLKQLQKLYACHLYNISDSSLMGVAEAGILTVLRIQGCKQLTDKFIGTLTRCCHGLEEVDIAGCSSLSLMALRQFTLQAARRPECHLLLYLQQSDFTDGFELDFPTPKSLTLISNFRDLYMWPMEWIRDSDLELVEQFRHQNEDVVVARLQGFPRDDIDGGGPADFYNSDDHFIDFDDVHDEFLVNDDPLEAERFEPS